jgi:hypothetical protein
MFEILKGNGKKQQQAIETWIPAYFDRVQVVEALARLRTEWEVAVDGESLMEAQTSVGLLLGDLALQLDLTTEEQKIALGDKLRNDFFKAIRSL